MYYSAMKYKSLKVTFATWQALTRIAAETGEAKMQIVERLAQQEEDRLLRGRPDRPARPGNEQQGGNDGIF